jgi:hypothetical protein
MLSAAQRQAKQAKKARAQKERAKLVAAEAERNRIDAANHDSLRIRRLGARDPDLWLEQVAETVFGPRGRAMCLKDGISPEELMATARAIAERGL